MLQALAELRNGNGSNLGAEGLQRREGSRGRFGWRLGVSGHAQGQRSYRGGGGPLQETAAGRRLYFCSNGVHKHVGEEV